MANLIYRKESVAKLLGSNLAPAASYTVTVCKYGGEVASASSGVTVTVRYGHGFVIGDRLIVGTDTSKFRSVSGVSLTTLTVNSAVSVATGDLLSNLGSDTGSGSPNWDGAGVPIFTDPAGSTAITNSNVTTGSDGWYTYCVAGGPAWEVIRVGSTVYRVVPDAVPRDVRFGALLPYSGVARWDTRGSYDNGPWQIGVANGGTGAHDHVLYHTYNARWNDTNANWERDTSSSHSIRMGFESRWNAVADPATTRGNFEWNLDFWRETTTVAGGVLGSFTRSFLHEFNVDPAATLNRGKWTFGMTDSLDDQLTIGVAADYGFVFNKRNDTNVKGFVFGLSSQTAADKTKPGRIVIDNNGSILSGDRGAYVMNAGGEQAGIAIEPGLTSGDVVGTVYLSTVRGGNVLIGASPSAPESKLEVYGGAVTIKIGDSSDTGIALRRQSQTYAQATLDRNGVWFGGSGAANSRPWGMKSTGSSLGLFANDAVNAKAQLLDGGGLAISGDSSGLASNVVFTGTSDVTANSTGVGSIKFKGATSRDSTGFIKVFIGTTAYYVPVFSAITG